MDPNPLRLLVDEVPDPKDLLPKPIAQDQKYNPLGVITRE